jgi:hypothetical protein
MHQCIIQWIGDSVEVVQGETSLTVAATEAQGWTYNQVSCISGKAFGEHAQDRVMKGKKKAKSHTQAQNKSRCKTEVFYGPFLPIWYCINLSFWYLDAVSSAATGVLFVWIPCGIPHVKTTR